MPQVLEILESLHRGAVLGGGKPGEHPQDRVCNPDQPVLDEFLLIPSGLKNSAAVLFQRLMNTMLAELLGKICFIYIDDIVPYSND